MPVNLPCPPVHILLVAGLGCARIASSSVNCGDHHEASNAAAADIGRRRTVHDAGACTDARPVGVAMVAARVGWVLPRCGTTRARNDE